MKKRYRVTVTFDYHTDLPIWTVKDIIGEQLIRSSIRQTRDFVEFDIRDISNGSL